METKEFNSILKTSFIFAFLISGVYFAFKGIFNTSVTGAVIGAQNASISILLGVVLFIGTLALAFHHDKDYREKLKERR